MICECKKFYANYEYQDKKYCSSCYEKVSRVKVPSSRIEYDECECKEGYFAYYELNDTELPESLVESSGHSLRKKYCSSCYEKKSGKSFGKKKYQFNSEEEIIETLNNVFSVNKLENKIIILKLKNINTESEFYKLIEEIHKKNIYFISTEATIILEYIKNIGTKKIHVYENIICSKVVDYWRMNSSNHGVGFCYYSNWGDKPKIINDAIIHVNNNEYRIPKISNTV